MNEINLIIRNSKWYVISTK